MLFTKLLRDQARADLRGGRDESVLFARFTGAYAVHAVVLSLLVLAQLAPRPTSRTARAVLRTAAGAQEPAPVLQASPAGLAARTDADVLGALFAFADKPPVVAKGRWVVFLACIF